MGCSVSVLSLFEEVVNQQELFLGTGAALRSVACLCLSAFPISEIRHLQMLPASILVFGKVVLWEGGSLEFLKSTSSTSNSEPLYDSTAVGRQFLCNRN